MPNMPPAADIEDAATGMAEAGKADTADAPKEAGATEGSKKYQVTGY